MHNIYDFKINNIDGQEVDFSIFKGKVLLVVNVASKCGFTKQYAGLEQLYQQYKDNGLLVLGFPCNQFGGQEPGNEAEIKQFCNTKYDVTFPLFSKIEVNGANTHPLYKMLKSKCSGILGSKAIKWNFTKFLVDKHGKVTKRYASVTEPAAISTDIEHLLSS